MFCAWVLHISLYLHNLGTVRWVILWGTNIHNFHGWFGNWIMFPFTEINASTAKVICFIVRSYSGHKWYNKGRKACVFEGEESGHVSSLADYRAAQLLGSQVVVLLSRLNPSRLKRKSGGPASITPSLLGEMLLHSNQVKVMNIVQSALCSNNILWWTVVYVTDCQEPGWTWHCHVWGGSNDNHLESKAYNSYM